MPADFYIDAQRGIVLSKAKGTLDYEEARDYLERLGADAAFRPELNQLVDLRGVTKFALSHDELRALAQRRLFAPTSRRAFVVSRDLDFGIVRTFTGYREVEGGGGLQVFKEMSEALAWLSLSEEPDERLFLRLSSDLFF